VGGRTGLICLVGGLLMLLVLWGGYGGGVVQLLLMLLLLLLMLLLLRVVQCSGIGVGAERGGVKEKLVVGDGLGQRST